MEQARRQGPADHLRVLDHQGPCHDARGDRRRHGHDDHELGLPRRHRAVSGGARWCWCTCRSARSAFHPWLYWATIVASTTAGTTMADFADRSLGIGYAGRRAAATRLRPGELWLWQRTCGSISLQMLKDPKAEAFYWLTITFSQTLGTALGDWTADDSGLGYENRPCSLAPCWRWSRRLYFWTRLSRVWLFWAAFILTRPLGATVGDFLDKPLDQGGLAFSRPLASAVIAGAMILCIALFPKNASRRRAPRAARGLLREQQRHREPQPPVRSVGRADRVAAHRPRQRSPAAHRVEHL